MTVITLMTMCFSTMLSAEEGINVSSENISVENMFLVQQGACEAHEVLYNSFEWDKTYVYPDDFAGDYIDYDTLHILVTDENAIGYYENLLSEYKDYVMYDIVEYSYEMLYDETESFAACLKEEYDVTSYGIDVKENKGFIRVLSSDYEEVMSVINSQSTYNSRNTQDMFVIESQEGYIKKNLSIVAGSPISFVMGSMTLGGSGTYNNAVAFVTSGHGLYEADTIKYGNSTIGVVDKVQFENNKYGDYAIIAAASGYTSSSSVFTTSGNLINFEGYLTDPAVGTYLYKYGKETGQAYCEVTRTNVSTYDTDYYITIKGLTETKILSGSADVDGNSGGPYRCGKDFCGIHSGSVTSNSVNYTYFTPYKYLYNAGFLIDTQ